jgi:2'-5' RNA ligase
LTRLGRAFLAVVPPAAVLDAVAARLAPLAPGEALRWLPRPQWHVTLQFLGPVDDAEHLAAALEPVLATRTRCTAQLAGGGAFPTPRRATVLWIGVEPAGALAGLAATVTAVTAVTAELGHVTEPRRYHPHLTVARAARPRPMTRAVDALGADPVGPPWTVAEVALVQSDLRPDGARHTVWRPLPLGNA